jgi:hypothetical protein
MIVHWRDGVEVAAHLFSNPIFANCLELNPYGSLREQIMFMVNLCLEISHGTIRHMLIHTKYHHLSKPVFFKYYQTCLPGGHCFLGIILTSDKTPLTIGTGNKEMHPVLLSLANIDAGICMRQPPMLLFFSVTYLYPSLKM